MIIDIQMFAEGAAGAAAPASANATGGAQIASDAGTSTADTSNAVKAEVDSAVKATESETKPEETAEKHEKIKFSELIKDPDYAHDLSDLVDKAVGRKHAQLKDTEKRLSDVRAEYDTLTPALDFLRARYGVKSNLDLANAVMNDDAILEPEAEKRGMDTSQYREKLNDEREKARLMRENEELKNMQQQQTSRMQFDADVKRLVEESISFKAKNPTFDLREESKNKQFLFYAVECKMPIEAAYNACHMNDIIHAAEERGKAAAAANFKSNKSRPFEMMGGTGATVVPEFGDVSKMTREQRDDLSRRIKAGEFSPR